jgi:hypothetical protein
LVAAVNVTTDLKVESVRNSLSLVPGLDGIDLAYSGTCADFTYTVTMVTRPGNQPQLTVSKKKKKLNYFVK